MLAHKCIASQKGTDWRTLWIQSFGCYKLLGTTTDDAIGEAFDKVARLLLPQEAEGQKNTGAHSSHPGARLEALANTGDPAAWPLTEPMLRVKVHTCLCC